MHAMEVMGIAMVELFLSGEAAIPASKRPVFFCVDGKVPWSSATAPSPNALQIHPATTRTTQLDRKYPRHVGMI